MFNKSTSTTLAQTVVSTRSKLFHQFAKPAITGVYLNTVYR